MNSDTLREACAVFGAFVPGGHAATVAFFGLFALQHRGQESSGIAVSNGARMEVHTRMGLVSQVFTEEILQRLQGHIAVGHNRYSTTGHSTLANAQPFLVESPFGPVALAHNGNLVNYNQLRKELEEKGVGLTSTSDSEVIAKLFSITPGKTIEEKLLAAVKRLRGAFSVVMATKDTLIGFRDPWGIRPLVIGRLLRDGEPGWILASESCSLNTVGADWLRELLPGEAAFITDNGLRTFQLIESPRNALCLFEFVYFARPDTRLYGETVYVARYKMGQVLARQYPPYGMDAVMAIPDSSVPAAIGFSAESGIPYMDGLIKNRYIARTFIQPDQHLRKMGIKLKFNPIVENIRGKKLILIDDSIVRGNTTKAIVALLREVGAEEIHVRITSPPMMHPCFLGLDTATYEELIASSKTVEEIRSFIGADSLGYLSFDTLVATTTSPREKFCTACFSGDYPIAELNEHTAMMRNRCSGNKAETLVTTL